MSWWPRKAEPITDWKLHCYMFCRECGKEVETPEPIISFVCEECRAAIRHGDRLSWAEIDHFGASLVSQGVTSVDSPEEA